MGVIIDQVDGEMQQPAPAPPPAQPGAQPDSPELEMEELAHKMAVLRRRHHRLHAD